MYDAFDRRIEKAIDTAAPFDMADAKIERYVYDGMHIALVFQDPDGAGSAPSSLTNRFLHGPAIDQILADEQVDSLLSEGDILWPLTDNLGTVRDLASYDAVFDETTIVSHIEYDSFGNVTAESNVAVDHLFGYTGRELDDETGMQHNRARYYEAPTGRFISEDPIGLAGGINLGAYAGNNPTNFTDPSGLQKGPPVSFIPSWLRAVDPTLVGQPVFYIPISAQWQLSRIARHHAYTYGCVGLAQVRLGTWQEPSDYTWFFERWILATPQTSSFTYPHLAQNVRMFASWNDAVQYAADQQKLGNYTRIFALQFSGSPINPNTSGTPPYMTEINPRDLDISRTYNFATLHCDSGNFYSTLGWYWEWMAGGRMGGDSDVRRSPSLPLASYPNVFYGVAVYKFGEVPTVAPSSPWRE